MSAPRAWLQLFSAQPWRMTSLQRSPWGPVALLCPSILLAEEHPLFFKFQLHTITYAFIFSLNLSLLMDCLYFHFCVCQRTIYRNPLLSSLQGSKDRLQVVRLGGKAPLPTQPPCSPKGSNSLFLFVKCERWHLPHKKDAVIKHQSICFTISTYYLLSKYQLLGLLKPAPTLLWVLLWREG